MREDWCQPEQGTRCFDQLPATVERLLTGAVAGPALDEPLLADRFDRVVFVYFDAFGWAFLERHAGHALFAQARSDGLLVQLTSQFPSTTTAQVTTIHSGLPVAEHGLYEWHVYEPSLDRLITPLLFSFAGDGVRGTLLGQIDPDALFPTDSIYVRLAEAGVPSTVVLPATIAASAPNIALLRGTHVVPFENAEDGLAAAAAALRGGAGYAHLYLDELDSLMHAVGTDDPAVDVVTRRVLDDVHRATFPPGTLVLLTADHGMSPVDPGRTVYVNELWPELATHLETGADGKPLAPAGSCRDLFLHARDGHVDAICSGPRGAARRRRGCRSGGRADRGGLLRNALAASVGAPRERRRSPPLRRGGVLARAGPLRPAPPRPARRPEPAGDGDPARRLGRVTPSHRLASRFAVRG